MADAKGEEATVTEAKILQQEIDMEKSGATKTVTQEQPGDKANKDEDYTWSETNEDLDIRIPFKVNFKVKGKDVVVEFKKKHLKAGLKGNPLIIDGELYNDIKIEDSTYTVNDNELLITLEKVDKRQWNRIFTIDPEKVQPEESKLPDEDCMVEQNKEKRQEAIEKLKEKYPGIDLAKCTFS